MKKLIACTIACIAFACNNDKTAPAEEVEILDSAQTAQSIATEDSSIIYKNDGVKWMNNALKLPGTENNITLKSFWSEEAATVKPFSPAANFYRDYATVLHWAPDSNYILDVNSSGLMTQTDEQGKVTLTGGDPDSEVSLINMKRKERSSILLSGPSAAFINARWLSNTEVALLGTEQSETGKTDTLMWIINVDSKLYRLYGVNAKK